MSSRTPGTRRNFLKLSLQGLAAAPLAATPLAGALLTGNASAQAQALPLVTETDPQAQALGYKADASKAPNRKPPTAHCGDCNFFTGKPTAADGPCAIFPGKLVHTKGWCTAWAKKA